VESQSSAGGAASGAAAEQGAAAAAEKLKAAQAELEALKRTIAGRQEKLRKDQASPQHMYIFRRCHRFTCTALCLWVA